MNVRLELGLKKASSKMMSSLMFTGNYSELSQGALDGVSMPATP